MPSSVDVQGPTVNALVEVVLAEEQAYLPSRVEDVRDGAFVVAAPGGAYGTALFREPGTSVALFWVLDGEAYSIPATVAAVDRGAVPTWTVRPTGPPERGQRRRFFRVATLVPAELRQDDDEVGPVAVAATMVDVGEGGARCTVAADVAVEEGSALRVSFRLGDDAYDVAARVVRSRPTSGDLRELALSFEDLAERDATRIRRYGFAEQRRLRQAGLA